MKQPEYIEGPEAPGNFKRLVTAILQAPAKKKKNQTRLRQAIRARKRAGHATESENEEPSNMIKIESKEDVLVCALYVHVVAELKNGIADGSYKQPVQATIQIGGKEYLKVRIDQDKIHGEPLRPMTLSMFPLDLNIKDAGGKIETLTLKVPIELGLPKTL